MSIVGAIDPVFSLESEPTTLQTVTTDESHVPASLGYAQDNTGTRAIMNILGGRPTDDAPATRAASDVATQYKALLRLLPANNHVDNLVRFFFAEISWQYDVVNEDMFREQLSDWRRVSYASRSNPQGLDPMLRYFPALLFQVLAQSVLLQPPESYPSLEDLKPAPDMELLDLAKEFSDAGHQILSILGSTEPALVKIQAGLQRATFLKSTGSVIEAWHVLGSAIRDAQELGLHRLYDASNLEVWTNVEQSRSVAAGRKIWLVLHLWDAHMGVVLGRPMITQLNPDTIPFPCHGARGGDGHSGDSVQQVTPFDVILCGYHVAYKHLQDIHKLEPLNPDALKVVDRINAAILEGIAYMPAWARSSSPLHDYHSPWLPAARETLVTEIHFTLLALHRPFIFARSQNRIEALKAALQVLQSQSRLFCVGDPRKFPAFNLVFATFDATVIVAAIHILFPRENQELLQSSVQCVEWAVERLRAMKAQSALAASAYTAIHELYHKLLNSFSGTEVVNMSLQNTRSEGPLHTTEQISLNGTDCADSQEGAASNFPQDLEHMLFDSPLYNMSLQDLTNMPSIYSFGTAATNTHGAQAATHTSLDADLERMLPPLPLHDLIAQNPTTDAEWTANDIGR